jgi:hypothetical protein
VGVHVRLGDYMRHGTAEFHGVTSPEWSLIKAHEMASELGLSGIRLFTDSPGLVADLVPTRLLDGVEFDVSEKPLRVLASMSRSHGFVMSNSSLSWWGAFLAQRRRPAAPVYFPTPWCAQPSEIDQRLSLPKWRVVERRILEV